MTTVALDIDRMLDSLDRMASQRPVAARIVATINKESSGAAELAGVLGADVALAAKVMKLANSAYFGLSGKVTSLQFAVTVVGFNTVRSIATVALSGVDTANALPTGFWKTSMHLAAASGTLGQQFRVRTADAMCVGLLAQLGTALLHQADPQGYERVVLTTDLGAERFAAESCRYGLCGPQLTAEALQQWRFPADMVEALRAVQSGTEGALVRTAYELTARLVHPGHRYISLERLSGNRIAESQAVAKMAAIRADVQELRNALGL
ncbi:HDOD domain-containing protein [Nocardioides humilatus]|uniref:HDOD domain-containing protein n=1 Tax=Nocardioides humilatus TaxID=2607660 RepID=A0A5B1LJX4_9ACTN|nr:HDOD domain-containing protein [Nocardioides humilatus]KAA1420982.1 HDOD domain-containing protein [Nocardioides humilatus]